MTSIHAILQEARQALESLSQAPQAQSEFDRLTQAISDAHDVHKAGQLYDALMRLPRPPEAPAAVPEDFRRWCETGRLPDTIEGLLAIEMFLRVYGEVP